MYPRLDGPTEIPEAWGGRITMLSNAPRIEVSSTFVRNSIGEGKDVRFFVPQRIWASVRDEFVKKNR